MASFVNKGVRPSEVHIFKRKVGINSISNLNQQNLLVPGYFGNYGKVCKAQVKGQGILVKCERSGFSCANKLLNFKF